MHIENDRLCCVNTLCGWDARYACFRCGFMHIENDRILSADGTLGIPVLFIILVSHSSLMTIYFKSGASGCNIGA